MKEAKLKCRICGRDLTVDFDETCPVEWLDKLAGCLTCDTCLKRLGRVEPETAKEKPQANLPYKDL